MAEGNQCGADTRRGIELTERFLAAEIARMRGGGVPVGEDEYRGLYVADAEAERILRRPLGEVVGRSGLGGLRDELAALQESARGELGRVAALRDLTAEDLGCLLLCLASETDYETERLIAYAQDDVSKRRPRVDLAMRLFGGGRDRFESPSPLRKLRLVRLLEEPGQAHTPLIARQIALDPGVAAFLCGSSALAEAIEAHSTAVLAGESFALPAAEAWAAIRRLAALQPDERPAVVALTGADAELIRRAAFSVLRPAAGGMIEVDFPSLKAAAGLEEAFMVAAREAALREATLLLRELDALTPREATDLATLAERESWARPLAFVSREEFRWAGVCLAVPALDFEQRRAEWIVATGGRADTEPIETTAGRFRLTTEDIRHAAARAKGIAMARDPGSAALEPDDLLAAARSQSTPILSGLATKVTPHHHWPDIVLAPDTMEQLQEMCGHVEHRHLVYDLWGFDQKLASSKGLMSLFAGQSGTGKTMAADVLANTLGLDLYRIDLSGVVSKYIGETEKNLASVFNEAASSNAMLFFDEADALFGKRSEVKDAHDRYANIETAYLLQRMEEYEGVVILATNLKMNLDEAFLRRLHFVIDFPMPDETQRRRIWRGTVPDAAPLAAEVDWDFLARQFKVSGGNIRNAVLAAAFLAAQDGTAIATSHLVRGLRREYQKLGRMISDAEFGPYADLVRGSGRAPA